jgi:LacI family transcriptional regulator
MIDTMSHAFADAPNVAVLIDTSTGWGRRLIRGVVAYGQKHGPWHLRVEPRGRTEHLSLPVDWAGNGVIARIATPRMHQALQRLGVPIVNISAIDIEGCDCPRVTSDYQAAARMMADHFLDRGFHNFAYVGPLQYAYVRQHLDAVQKALLAANNTSTVARFDYRFQSVANRGWAVQDRHLTRWLQEQPKPLAVIGWATVAAAHVLDACRNVGLVVPDDVAVLASDDDTLLNNATVPPMSGLLVASHQTGYRAAAMLDTLMRGGHLETPVERIAPIEIVTRGSTETFAIQDPELLRAVVYIRQNAFRPLTVEEVAYAVPLARRSLERKFRDHFGRTPLEEISRLRLARAKQLLVQTDQSIAEVAEACGYRTAEYLATRFRRAVGITPLRYRTAARGG